ncbi:MAG: EAL domain-containing protein [Lachnospiraceae bacterium]|nr:EAL domain-containing protein [Lachnospiraceae bacterium]
MINLKLTIINALEKTVSLPDFLPEELPESLMWNVILEKERTEEAVEGGLALFVTDDGAKAHSLSERVSERFRMFLIADAGTIAEMRDFLVGYCDGEEDFKRALLETIGRMKMEFDLWFYKHALLTTINTVPDMLWYKRLDGIHTMVNDSFCEVLHKEKDAIIGHDHYDIWDVPRPTEGSEGFDCSESEEIAINTGKTYICDEPVKTREGMKQLTTYKTPVYDMAGNVYGTIGVGHDVTNFSNLGIELSILIENLPFPMLILSQKRKVVRMNSIFAEIAGLSTEEEKEHFAYEVWKKQQLHVVGELKVEPERHLCTQEFIVFRGDEEQYLDVTELEIRDFFDNVSGYFVTMEDITYHRAYEQSILNEANTDKLTGMYNRRYFYEYLENQAGKAFYLLYMDLDHFKEVNDTYGHRVGDDVLKKTAHFIEKYFPQATSARMGGDEFVVAEGAHDKGYIERQCEALELAVKDAFRYKCGVTVSIGMVYNDGSITDPEEMIHKGDRLMYEIKEAHHSSRDGAKPDESAAEEALFKDDDGYYTLRYYFKVMNTCQNDGILDHFFASHFRFAHFTLINRQLGRNTGMLVLKRFIEGLEKQVGEGGVVCHLGGDTFVLLAQKTALSAVIDYFKGQEIVYDENNDERVQVSTTAGIYEIPSNDSLRDVTDVMDRIISASIKAHSGRENIVYFTEEMQKQRERSDRIQSMFSDALKNEEFLVYYQPKVSLSDEQLAGAEALCRWKRDGKIVPPVDFIPIFEQGNNICKLDFYMLEHVCRDLRRWLDQGKQVVRVSVNLSRNNLMNARLVDELIEVIDRYGIPHGYIEIELEETASDVEFRDLKRVVEGLQKKGVCTSVDNFGMGYSSLNLIWEIRWDVLKIDRSFAPTETESRDSRRNTMFRSVVALVHELGMECIVEGVETQAQVELLKANHCDLAQGFFFDKPLATEHFEERLDCLKSR